MNYEYFDTIHRYLAGSMEAGERVAFEAELKTNAQLREDVDLERLVLEGLEMAGEDAKVRESIAQTHQQLRAEGFFEQEAETTPHPLTITHSSNKSSFDMKRILSLAAALVVLLAGVWFFTSRNPAVDKEEIFAKYYNPDHAKEQAQKDAAALESHGLAGASTPQDSLAMAIQLYADGKLEDCVKMLNAYRTSFPNDETAQYYLGLAHLGLSRYAKAIELLFPLSRSSTFALKNDAMWYLGLCYLKAEAGVDEARQVFQNIANDPANPDHQAAKAILEQILRGK